MFLYRTVLVVDYRTVLVVDFILGLLREALYESLGRHI
jgi:hypothetical protein